MLSEEKLSGVLASLHVFFSYLMRNACVLTCFVPQGGLPALLHSVDRLGGVSTSAL